VIYRTAPFSVWTNPTRGFKVTQFFDAEYLRNSTRYRHSFNGIHALPNSVTSNDREWLTKTFSDMKRRAVSLQQLSFLSLLSLLLLHVRCCFLPVVICGAVKRLISLIALIAWLIFLIAVLTHILFVTFFNLFVFHLEVDVVSPLLLNASLLLVLTTDYSDWLVQVTEHIDSWQLRSLFSFE